MLFSKSSVFSVAISLAACADAHMLMASPKPYVSQNAQNGPLQASGSDYPCKGEQNYDAGGISNIWPVGSTQQLATIGQAVHGGGSCQISITYDKKPSKNSAFKVIHSIEGGCPARGTSGNRGDNAAAANPDTYSFKIPDGLPTGEAVVAWTWFNLVGNPEMYMNCAPVTITGAGGKRSEPESDLVARDTSFLNSLPDMFKANIGNGCGTAQQGNAVVFPNPGSSLEKNSGPFDVNHMFTGNCEAVNGPSNAESPAPSSAGAPAPSNTGGVFVPASPAPAAPTTLATSIVPAAPKETAPAPAPPSPGQNSASGCTTATYGATICSADGMQIGTCDYGGKIVMGSVATGTKCLDGRVVAVRSVSGRIRGRRYNRFTV